MALLEIWHDSISPVTSCRSCGAPIEWAEMVKSGKRMPFDAKAPGIVAVSTKHDPETHRLIDVVDSTVSVSHFSTCEQADKWRRK